jgi:hypothetical protein
MESRSLSRYRTQVEVQLQDWKDNKGTPEQINAAEELLQAIDNYEGQKGPQRAFGAPIPPTGPPHTFKRNR